MSLTVSADWNKKLQKTGANPNLIRAAAKAAGAYLGEKASNGIQVSQADILTSIYLHQLTDQEMRVKDAVIDENTRELGKCDGKIARLEQRLKEQTDAVARAALTSKAPSGTVHIKLKNDESFLKGAYEEILQRGVRDKMKRDEERKQYAVEEFERGQVEQLEKKTKLKTQKKT